MYIAFISHTPYLFVHSLVTYCYSFLYLLDFTQVYRDAESRQLLQDWLDERRHLKQTMKNIFNPQFGSIFRSQLSPSYFTGRLCRIADIYTSSVENLIHYYPDHFFFPIRSPLPHEHIISMAYQHDGYDSAIEEILNRSVPP